MKNILSLLFLFSFVIFNGQSIGSNQDISARESSKNYFIQNKGQILDQNGNPNNNVLYVLNTPGLNVQLRQDGFSYDVYEKNEKALINKKRSQSKTHFNAFDIKREKDSIIEEVLFHRVDIDFLETSKDLIIKEYQVSKSYINYYNIPKYEEGITKVRSFRKIVYQNLYYGIDVEFFVPTDIKKPVEYNFIIKPEANISDINMKISGAEVELENNALKMNLIHGNLHEIIPKSWIQNNQRKKEVTVNYVQKSKNVFGFKVNDKSYDENSILVVDPTPVRQWATYFGGERDETQYNGHIETDSNGNVFVSGNTRSNNNIATAGSFQTSYTNNTASWVGYLAMFSSTGNLIWGTYLGNGETGFRALAIDKDDNVIGVGDTRSTDNIATSGTHQQSLYDDTFGDAFVVKFNNSGFRIWGTYYGGERTDNFYGVSFDSNNNILVTGQTTSHENIATVNSFRDTASGLGSNNRDCIIVKLNENGQRVWATYYGGEAGFDIDVDSNNNIYVLGEVSRGEAEFEDISTPGAYQENYSDEGDLSWVDSFVVKFNTNGQREWGTFFGGDSYDNPSGIVIDHADNVIICGNTRSNVFKTTNAFQPNKGGAFYDWDAYLAKFDSNGQIQWNTFYGGTEGDSGVNVDVDSDNNIFLVGGTGSSNNIATTDSYQLNNMGSDDAYIAKFDPSGNRLWGTYYGGDNSDSGLDVEITASGDLYLLGYTFGSTNLATPGVHQETFNGEIDNFLVKFKDCLSSISASATEFLCSGEDVLFNASGGITYSWTGPNGFSSIEQNPTILNASINASGTYSVYIESGDGCHDTRTFDVLVSERPITFPINDIEVCEDIYGTGMSANLNTSNVEAQVLGGQINMQVSYFDSKGNQLPSPLPNPMTNSVKNNETITVKVANSNNPECYAETSFDLIVNPLPSIDSVTGLQECDDDSDGFTMFNLSQIQSDLSGNSNLIDFYFEDGTQIPNSQLGAVINKVPNEETITVRVTNTTTSCYNETTFKLIVNPLPVANPVSGLIGCDDNGDGISEYFDTTNVESTVLDGQNGMEVTYYDSAGNQINLTNPFTNSTPNQETIIVRVTNTTTNCYAETQLILNTSNKPQINTPEDIYACDEGDGYATFNLASIENEIIGNQTHLNVYYFNDSGVDITNSLTSSFENTIAWSQTISVKVENALSNLCVSETSFNVFVNDLPKVDIESEYFLCNLEPSLPISVNDNLDAYEWKFEDGTVISNTYQANLVDAGDYSLKIREIKNGISCENVYGFKLIRSVLPKIETVESQELSDNNFIRINASGDGDFQYSIDGNIYQNSNVFNNLLGGMYTVYVRDRLGCGIDSKEVILIDYPKYFTPNNDGKNDYWHIKGVQQYPSAIVRIFDRYGKFLKQLSASQSGWDGTFGGKKMPDSDYWFTVVLNEEKSFKGHFTLKR